MEQYQPDRGRPAPSASAPIGAPSEATSAIELIGLCVRFGATPALEDVSLRVREGEIFGLVGREGAGKSILLRAVAGQIAPSAGAISVLDAPNRSSERPRSVAYLPDRFRPPGELTGHEFLRVTLLMHGGSLDPAVVRTLARSLDLEPGDLGRPVHECGKGIAQKLGLLAMLLTDRPLLVLDEPLSGLTPDARARVKRALIAHRDRGRTILLASGIASDHEGLCDRIAVLRAGRLGHVGSITDLCRRLGAPTLTTALLVDSEGPRQSNSR
jgi:ABC-2 type transport system ATP-binding protein